MLLFCHLIKLKKKNNDYDKRVSNNSPKFIFAISIEHVLICHTFLDYFNAVQIHFITVHVIEHNKNIISLTCNSSKVINLYLVFFNSS